MSISNKCSVCKHKDVNEINTKLVSGVSPKQLADDYGLGFMSLYRHKDNHLPKTLVRAKQLQEESAADDLLDRVESIFERAWVLMEKAETDGKYQPAVSALKECRSCLELTGRLIGELRTGTEINIHYNPEFVQIRQQITEALLPFPEARQAVVKALESEVVDVDYEDIDQT